MASHSHLPLLELTRGDIVESVHYGSAAICDSNGKLIAWCGDPNWITYLRSTAKPLQALPFIEAGGDFAYNLNSAEIAIMCASHSGTDAHINIVKSLQSKAGIEESELLCGVHPPYDEDTQQQLRLRGEQPTPNRHNCSGKHSGMLASARLRNWSTADYIDPTHPLQNEILATLAEMADLSTDNIHIGIDGCSAPNFALPLKNSALAFARLCDPANLSARRARACRKITSAIMDHPAVIAGPGRFDTRLMEVAKGKLIAKGGAEGYQGVGILPGVLAPDSPGIGIALKIGDGDARGRARPAVTLEILRQLGVIDSKELESLSDFGSRFPITNWRNIVVGEGRPCFQLHRQD